MFTYRPFIRTIVEPSAGGSTSDTSEATSSSEISNKSPQQSANDKSESEDATGDEEEDSNARGSKTQVLADLARERDRRQASEAENAELKAKLEEFERAQMTEQEKMAADFEKAQARIAELEAEKKSHERDAAIMAAVKEAKLPAEMADRLRGDTAEELLADAKKLAQHLGYDQAPIDPSQGKNAGGKTHSRTLADAFRAHYNQ